MNKIIHYVNRNFNKYRPILRKLFHWAKLIVLSAILLSFLRYDVIEILNIKRLCGRHLFAEMRKLLMHSLQPLFPSNAPSKVSRSFNRDKSPRRDVFPPLLSGSRKRRRQSELQIEKYIIRTSHNFYENFKFFSSDSSDR